MTDAEPLPPTPPGWVAAARRRLAELRGDAAGWGYRPRQAPCVEPTAYACLGLLATATAAERPATRAQARGAGDWLARIRNADGSLGLSEEWPLPPWPTAHALLLWGALDRLGDGPPRYAAARKQAVDFLLKFEGTRSAKDPRSPMAHDTSIPGWPWVHFTHMWVEPTALALLALRSEGQGDHLRSSEGRRLLRDRSLPAGGWNYGNTVVLGTELRPHPGPSGLALLGLLGDPPAEEPVELGQKYLKKILPTLRAAPSLAPGLLALAAWGQPAAAADQWLADAFPPAAKRSDAAYQLAWLLCAAQPAATLRLIGAKP